MAEKIKINGCTLGEYIKGTRVLHNLSTQKLAEMTGVSAGYVNKIELDRTTNYDINRLKKLAQGLKIDMNIILQYLGYKETTQEVDDENVLIAYLRSKNLANEDIKDVIAYIEFLQYKRNNKVN